MTEKDSIKTLIHTASNVRHQIDGIEIAAYGYTMADVIKAVGGANENALERINQLPAHPVGEGTGADGKGGNQRAT